MCVPGGTVGPRLPTHGQCLPNFPAGFWVQLRLFSMPVGSKFRMSFGWCAATKANIAKQKKNKTTDRAQTAYVKSGHRQKLVPLVGEQEKGNQNYS